MGLKIDIKEREFKGVFELISIPYKDDRGYLLRLSEYEAFKKAGLNTCWAQETFSYIKKKYTIKGLHVSLPPSLEGKTITTINGKAMWVIVDLRKKSETFGQWDSVILSKENHKTLYVPKGFAHGVCTLTNNCDMFFRSDAPYQSGTGINWNDKELNINWPAKNPSVILERDSFYPSFNDFKEKYGGF